MVGDAEVSNQKLGELFLRDAENPNEWLLNQMTERIGDAMANGSRAGRNAKRSSIGRIAVYVFAGLAFVAFAATSAAAIAGDMDPWIPGGLAGLTLVLIWAGHALNKTVLPYDREANAWDQWKYKVGDDLVAIRDTTDPDWEAIRKRWALRLEARAVIQERTFTDLEDVWAQALSRVEAEVRRQQRVQTLPGQPTNKHAVPGDSPADEPAAMP